MGYYTDNFNNNPGYNPSQGEINQVLREFADEIKELKEHNDELERELDSLKEILHDAN